MIDKDADADYALRPMMERVVDLRRIPHSALLLGFGGALPFLVGGMLIHAGPPASAWADRALLAYGATILSFLGGIHWGLAMASRQISLSRLGPSVVPPLIAWSSLLVGGAAGYLTMAAAFALLLLYDFYISREGLTPEWYPALRLPLTLVVVVCLLLATLPR